jgi:hypothetical protein
MHAEDYKLRRIIPLSVSVAGVTLSEEHVVTVEANQDNPNGPMLEPVDTAMIGKPVIIEKVANRKRSE